MRKAWENFWFKAIDARQYAALRIAFGTLSAIYLFTLLPYVETQFSGAGWLKGIGQIAAQNGGVWSLLFIPAGGYSLTVAYLLVVAGLVSSLLLAIGWHSRSNAFIGWLVWISLWNRNPLLLDGDDAVLKLMCFYLMLSPCGNCWSVYANLKDRPQMVAVWPLRLVQFQICLIYFVSGWVKFHSQEWLDGSIMQYVLIHPQYSRWDGWTVIGSNMLIVKLLPSIAGLIMWWELLFPFLLMNTYSRKLSIIMGILFHLGLLLTMNLRWFAVIMLALYPALISNGCFLRTGERLANYFQARKGTIG